MTGRVVAVDATVVAGALAERAGSIDRAALATPAVLATTTLFLARLAINARAVPVDLVALQPTLLWLAGATAAAALAGIALVTPDPYEAVGLAFVAAFGAVGTVAEPAAGPAALAIVGGTALALVGQTTAADYHRFGPAAVGVLVIAGMAGSLLAAVGVAPVGARPLGSNLALIGIAASPVFLARRRRDWLVGATAAATLVALGVAAPFVLGATALVAGGIVGASVPVMALSVGGLTTTAAAALRTRRHAAALGAGLLLFAGVPGTIPRALAVTLALALLSAPAGGVERAG